MDASVVREQQELHGHGAHQDAMPAAEGEQAAGDAKPGRKSKYRGLTWDNHYRQWRVRIYYKGKQRQVGRYPDEVEAARAFDKASVYLFKARATTNFGLAAALEDPTPVSHNILAAVQQVQREEAIAMQQQQLAFQAAAAGEVGGASQLGVMPLEVAWGGQLSAHHSNQHPHHSQHAHHHQQHQQLPAHPYQQQQMPAGGWHASQGLPGSATWHPPGHIAAAAAAGLVPSAAGERAAAGSAAGLGQKRPRSEGPSGSLLGGAGSEGFAQASDMALLLQQVRQQLGGNVGGEGEDLPDSGATQPPAAPSLVALQQLLQQRQGSGEPQASAAAAAAGGGSGGGNSDKRARTADPSSSAAATAAAALQEQQSYHTGDRARGAGSLVTLGDSGVTRRPGKDTPAAVVPTVEADKDSRGEARLRGGRHGVQDGEEASGLGAAASQLQMLLQLLTDGSNTQQLVAGAAGNDSSRGSDRRSEPGRLGSSSGAAGAHSAAVAAAAAASTALAGEDAAGLGSTNTAAAVAQQELQGAATSEAAAAADAAAAVPLPPRTASLSSWSSWQSAAGAFLGTSGGSSSSHHSHGAAAATAGGREPVAAAAAAVAGRGHMFGGDNSIVDGQRRQSEAAGDGAAGGAGLSLPVKDMTLLLLVTKMWPQLTLTHTMQVLRAAQLVGDALQLQDFVHEALWLTVRGELSHDDGLFERALVLLETAGRLRRYNLSDKVCYAATGGDA